MPTRRSGFTLIELLIVVVIIGILAAIAIPKFGTTKGKANIAAMRSDLHNIAIAEEAYNYDTSAYSDDATELAYKASPGVRIVEMHKDISGWSAKVTHDQAFPKTCALFVGKIAALAPATDPGAVKCDN
jgi:prepilin-type N-terminal cleavage/methylation domain-containing protein